MSCNLDSVLKANATSIGQKSTNKSSQKKQEPDYLL